ncbi:hypothetical protein DH2020_006992 [Rehmannia glutinosa]|uniref:Uncharacterized protein n=1 Tax=Rehmannia glutinosa TaxID=99300 RepID=A0ABR0W717_REHGL
MTIWTDRLALPTVGLGLEGLSLVLSLRAGALRERATWCLIRSGVKPSKGKRATWCREEFGVRAVRGRPACQGDGNDTIPHRIHKQLWIVSLVEGNNLDGPILSMGLTKDKVTEEGNKTMGPNEEMKDGLANGPGKTYTKIRPKRALASTRSMESSDHLQHLLDAQTASITTQLQQLLLTVESKMANLRTEFRHALTDREASSSTVLLRTPDLPSRVSIKGERTPVPNPVSFHQLQAMISSDSIAQMFELVPCPPAPPSPSEDFSIASDTPHQGNNLDGPILSMGLTKDKVTEEGNKTMGPNEEMKDGLANGPGKTYTKIRPKRAVRLPAWLKDYDHSMGK